MVATVTHRPDRQSEKTRVGIGSALKMGAAIQMGIENALPSFALPDPAIAVGRLKCHRVSNRKTSPPSARSLVSAYGHSDVGR